MSEPGGPGVAATAHSNAQMRQVLAAYVRNAHTLTGPSRLEEQIGAGKFNLAKDVVLHRVGAGPVDNRREPVYPSSHPVDINKQIWIQRERFMRQVQEHSMQMQSEKERLRQNRHNSGQDRANHLSGEKIRLLRETQKEAEKLRMEAERRSVKAEEMKESNHRKSAFKPATVSAVPIMSSSDKSWSDLEETIIGGERISCFNVGGEPRLCLPQILNSVLERLSLTDINQACEELQIYCATCSPDQLQVLKESKVLPETAYQCGLITKSDVERLCSFLLERNPPRASIRLGDPKTSPFSFKVEHDCFGHCEGLVLPEAYTEPSARCIECLECEGLFSPQTFVTHAHTNKENRTCHWGFSSENWRVYLRLGQEYAEEEVDRHAKILQDFKLRFVPPHNGVKRQQDDDHYAQVFSRSKRSKEEEDPYPSYRPWHQPFPYPPYPPPKEQGLERKYPAATVERYKEAPTHPLPVSPKKKYLEREHERFPTLADEISTIKEALEGAPVHAKEAVLKILERLTARVDRAERDRDAAVARYRDLQVQHGLLEEELAKKRGELRELLRQDINGGGGGLVKPAPAAVKDPEIDQTSEGSGSSGAAVTISAVDNTDSTAAAAATASLPASTVVSIPAPASVRNKLASAAAGLPKIELQSPVSVIQEIARSRSSSARSEAREVYSQPSKAPENMKDRMVKMEAELNLLREELSIRSRTSPATAPLSYSSQKLGSNGANSNSPTPSPPSNSEDPPSLAE